MAGYGLSVAQVAALEALEVNSLAPVRAGTLTALTRHGFVAQGQNGHELLSAARAVLAERRGPDSADEVDGGGVPSGLRERGRALWADIAADRDLRGGNYAVAEEACRIADRLDTLDAALRGQDVWLRVKLPRGDESDLVLVVDSALAEARQQATVLRQLVAQLPVREDDEDDDGTGDFLDGLGVSSP